MVVTMEQLSRSQRRALLKQGKKKKPPVRRSANGITNAVREAVFRKRFEDLQCEAERVCEFSNDIPEIVGVVGQLLFVTVKAVSLEEMEVEEHDVVACLSRMENELETVMQTREIGAQTREDLQIGLDYLDALSRAVSTAALDMSWWRLNQILTSDQGFGVDDIRLLLNRISKVKACDADKPPPLD